MPDLNNPPTKVKTLGNLLRKHFYPYTDSLKQQNYDRDASDPLNRIIGDILLTTYSPPGLDFVNKTINGKRDENFRRTVENSLADADVDDQNIFTRETEALFFGFCGIPVRYNDDGEIVEPIWKTFTGWHSDKNASLLKDFGHFILALFLVPLNLLQIIIKTSWSTLTLFTEIIPKMGRELCNLGIRELTSQINKSDDSFIDNVVLNFFRHVAVLPLTFMCSIFTLWSDVGSVITSPLQTADKIWNKGEEIGGFSGFCMQLIVSPVHLVSKVSSFIQNAIGDWIYNYKTTETTPEPTTTITDNNGQQIISSFATATQYMEANPTVDKTYNTQPVDPVSSSTDASSIKQEKQEPASSHFVPTATVQYSFR